MYSNTLITNYLQYGKAEKRAQIEAAKYEAAREWVYEKVSWSYRDPEPSDYED